MAADLWLSASRMETRPLKSSDFSEVEEVFKQSFPRIPVKDLHTSWSYRSKKNTIGLFIGDSLIGFMIASIHKSSGNSLYVDYVAITEEYRGSGIGTDMILQLVTECYDNNGSIHLFPEREDIVPWYERNGFRKTHGGYYVFHSYSTRLQHQNHRQLGLALML